MLLPAPAASRSVMLVYATGRHFWGWGGGEQRGSPCPWLWLDDAQPVAAT